MVAFDYDQQTTVTAMVTKMKKAMLQLIFILYKKMHLRIQLLNNTTVSFSLNISVTEERKKNKQKRRIIQLLYLICTSITLYGNKVDNFNENTMILVHMPLRMQIEMIWYPSLLILYCSIVFSALWDFNNIFLFYVFYRDVLFSNIQIHIIFLFCFVLLVCILSEKI